jgi:hypothetical protein
MLWQHRWSLVAAASKLAFRKRLSRSAQLGINCLSCHKINLILLIISILLAIVTGSFSLINWPCGGSEV